MIDSELDYAYIAGIIDGEGCIDLFKRKSAKYVAGYQLAPRITVTNTDICLLEYIKDFTNLGTISTYERPNKPHWKRAHLWQLYGSDNIKFFLESLLPYLRVKKQQACLLISFVSKTSKHHQGLSDDERKEQQIIFDQMKLLNKKGRG